ncbi:lipopolysaccharide biosynthesis protein [Gracilibacillus marinus]|uniref:Lipopolysaccharide biosynthesis protein n=1 Tax=Gracilibacillus marinus TaxID=630535 RepID=A0ABV8VU25_9BACI
MIKKLRNSSLIRNSGIYTFANIINSAIPFFLLPILTVYLTPTDYGIVSMFGVLIGIVLPFMGLNSNASISRKFYDEDKDFSVYLSTALYILVASSFAVLLIFLIFSDVISELSAFPQQYLLIVVVAGLGNSLIQITLTLWRVREKPILFGIFQISQTIMNVSVSLLLVVGLSQGWQGRVNGQVIAILLFAIIGIIIVIKRERVGFTYNNAYAKDIVSYGVPLIPHALGAFLITMTDRIFITNMIGVGETGIYTVAYQIGMIIQLLQDSFNKAWIPYLFSNLKKGTDQIKVKIVKISYIYFILIIIITLLLSLLAPYIVDIFIGEAFVDSVQFIFWISLGFAFNGMYKMISGPIFYVKKTRILSFLTFVTAILNIIFNYWFIKWNGTLGAAQATTLSFFITFILSWILAQRVYPMPWRMRVSKN